MATGALPLPLALWLSSWSEKGLGDSLFKTLWFRFFCTPTIAQNCNFISSPIFHHVCLWTCFCPLHPAYL